MLNGQLTVAAKIGESEYGTLQEAVNAAKSGDTIVLTQDCDEKISVSGKSVTIDLDGHTYDKDKITLGSRCSMSVSDDKITITYSAPSGGGSSSSSRRSLGSRATALQPSGRHSRHRQSQAGGQGRYRDHHRQARQWL